MKRKFISQLEATSIKQLKDILEMLEDNGTTENNGYTIEINSWTFGWFIRIYKRKGE